MPQRKHERDQEEHHNGDGKQNAYGKLLHLLHIAFYLYLGLGASNPSIENPRTRAAKFLGLAVVAVSSIAVLYWETAWESAATQGEGVVARSADGCRPTMGGANQDLMLQCHR